MKENKQQSIPSRFLCKCGAEREIIYFPEVTQCRLCKRIGCWIPLKEIKLVLTEKQ